MGVFTRFRDIISSNMNAMLDKAENPQKLIRLMVREMEDTLVELKASCAGAMAERKKIQRQVEEAQTRVEYWRRNAGLAVSKGRDDLAREALVEKRRYSDRHQALDRELMEHDGLIDQYQEDIRQLEGKLQSAKEKERILIQRHIHATRKRRAQEDIRRMDSSEAVFKFEELEQRIERMEADAELVNFGRKPTLEDEFDKLDTDEDIERELETLKKSSLVKDAGESSAS
jgi:phage shock protein A